MIEGHVNITSYEGYEVDCGTIYELDSRRLRVLDAAVFLVDHNATIRNTAANVGYCKSTLHKHIHTILKSTSYELYQCTCRVLNNHRRNRRR